MKVVFLDRDGVINKYPGDNDYVKSWKEFEFIPGSIEGLRKLCSYDFRLIVISNQAGVGKRIFSKENLDIITKKMLSVLKKKDVYIDGVYYCTHRKEDNCFCRKPKIALLHRALSDLKIKPNISFFIGDSFVDMETARKFGAKTILLLSGKEKISNRPHWKFEPEYIFDNLLVASHYLCEHFG
ncbi:MAG: HAD family hydrolase [Candidatus Omnitrophica bacterium]|nr:HAD family hydrolase [Candidatus Omnitrophota bacterium]